MRWCFIIVADIAQEVRGVLREHWRKEFGESKSIAAGDRFGAEHQRNEKLEDHHRVHAAIAAMQSKGTNARG